MFSSCSSFSPKETLCRWNLVSSFLWNGNQPCTAKSSVQVAKSMGGQAQIYWITLFLLNSPTFMLGYTLTLGLPPLHFCRLSLDSQGWATKIKRIWGLTILFCWFYGLAGWNSDTVLFGYFATNPFGGGILISLSSLVTWTCPGGGWFGVAHLSYSWSNNFVTFWHLDRNMALKISFFKYLLLWHAIRAQFGLLTSRNHPLEISEYDKRSSNWWWSFMVLYRTLIANGYCWCLSFLRRTGKRLLRYTFRI